MELSPIYMNDYYLCGSHLLMELSPIYMNDYYLCGSHLLMELSPIYMNDYYLCGSHLLMELSPIYMNEGATSDYLYGCKAVRGIDHYTLHTIHCSHRNLPHSV